MANCPNCGSNHIQLTTETNVNWGRAAVGYVLFGVVGGAVGAVTGEDKQAIICLDCGTSWKPTQLYQILRTIETLIEIKIDLTKSSHRIFVNDFISQITPYIESITSKEKKGEELIKKTEEDSNAVLGCGCGLSLVTVIGGLLTAGVVGFVSELIFGIITLCIVFVVLGALIDYFNKDINKRKLDEAKFQAERMKLEATEELNRVLEVFLISHPLE